LKIKALEISPAAAKRGL